MDRPRSDSAGTLEGMANWGTYPGELGNTSDLDPLEGLDLSKPLDNLDSELDPLEGLEGLDISEVTERADNLRSQALGAGGCPVGAAGLAGCLSEDVVELLFTGPLCASDFRDYANSAAKTEVEQRGTQDAGADASGGEVKPDEDRNHVSESAQNPDAVEALLQRFDTLTTAYPLGPGALTALPRVPGVGDQPGKTCKDEIIRQAKQQAADGTLNRKHQLIAQHAKAEVGRLASLSHASLLAHDLPASPSHVELVARQARAELNRRGLDDNGAPLCGDPASTFLSGLTPQGIQSFSEILTEVEKRSADGSGRPGIAGFGHDALAMAKGVLNGALGMELGEEITRGIFPERRADEPAGTGGIRRPVRDSARYEILQYRSDDHANPAGMRSTEWRKIEEQGEAPREAEIVVLDPGKIWHMAPPLPRDSSVQLHAVLVPQEAAEKWAVFSNLFSWTDLPGDQVTEVDVSAALPTSHTEGWPQVVFMDTRELTNLYVLRIDLNKLQRMPAGLLQLTALVHLHAHHNAITELPEGFGNLINLEELYLHDNKLTSLPASFCKLTQLRELHLCRNQLTALPEGFCAGVSELWYLGVSSNPMTHLPDDIGTMQNMLYLIAAWCKFKKLPQSISNLMHLHELNVRGNELTELPTMHNLRCLQELYVQGNQLMYLPDGLRYSRQLQHLQVHENSLTELPASLGTINIPDQIERTLRLIEPLELRIDDHIETDWKIKETWSHFNVNIFRTNRTARQIKMLTTRAKRAMAVAPLSGDDTVGFLGSVARKEQQPTDHAPFSQSARNAKKAAPALDDRDLDALVNDIENVSIGSAIMPEKKKKKKKKKKKATDADDALVPPWSDVGGATRDDLADDVTDGLPFDAIDTTLPNRVMGGSIMAPDDDDYSRILREILGEEADDQVALPQLLTPPQTCSYDDLTEVPAFVDATADSVQIDASFLPDVIAKPGVPPATSDEDSDAFYDAPGGGIKSDLGDIVGYLHRLNHAPIDPDDTAAPTLVTSAPASEPVVALNRVNEPGFAPHRGAQDESACRGVDGPRMIAKTIETGDPDGLEKAAADRDRDRALARPNASSATLAAASKPPAPTTSEADKDAEIKKLHDEIARLKEAAAAAQSGASLDVSVFNDPMSSEAKKKKKKKKKK